MDKTNIVNVILGAIAFSGVIFGVLIYYLKSRDERRKELKKTSAELSHMRELIERQMYGINERLVQSEERWKDVNHLLLRKEYTQNLNPLSSNNKVQLSSFLEANGITKSDLVIQPKQIFVLTPFHETFDEDFNTVKNVCSITGFKCIKGDETFFKGDIFPEMLKLIVESKLIIANINGRNANVLYELGIAQALDKAVILISRRPETSKLPIDIKSKRLLVYSDLNELYDQLRVELLNL